MLLLQCIKTLKNILELKNESNDRNIRSIQYMTRQDMTDEQKAPYIKYFEDGYTLGLIEQMTNTRIEE